MTKTRLILTEEQLSQVQELVRNFKGRSRGSSIKREHIKRERQNHVIGRSKKLKMEIPMVDLTEDDE